MRTSVLIAALPLAALAPQDSLRCAPEAGLALRKSFEREALLELVSIEMKVDGSPHEGPPQPELSVEVRKESVFVDRCERVEDGRAARLVRSFERLREERVDRIAGDEGGAGPQEHTASASSELEGRSVAFTWNGEAGEYEAAFEEGEGDGELLEGLVAELDLCAFLPARAVGEGESWDVPAAAFAALLCPSGDLQLVSDRAGPLRNDVQLAASLAGSIRATLRPEREEGGLALSVIGLELELSARARRELEDGSGEERQENDYELSGELAWIPAAGRFYAVELSGEVRSRVITTRTVGMGGQEFETERIVELAGELTYRVRAEAP